METLVGVMSPFLALISAIGLYYLNRRSDRADAAREKRKDIYARHLAAFNEVHVRVGARNLKRGKVGESFAEVMGTFAEMEVFAPDWVYYPAQRHLEAVAHAARELEAQGLLLNDTPDPDQEQQTKIAEILDKPNASRLEALMAMRHDTTSGSGFAPHSDREMVKAYSKQYLSRMDRYSGSKEP